MVGVVIIKNFGGAKVPLSLLLTLLPHQLDVLNTFFSLKMKKYKLIEQYVNRLKKKKQIVIL